MVLSPTKPEMIDLLFGFFLKDNSDHGEEKMCVCLQKQITVLNLAGWVNILKCWFLPSTDSIFLKEIIIFQNRRVHKMSLIH